MEQSIDMKAADAETMMRARQYIAAAKRCSAWRGDEDTEARLGRLAAEYRGRAMALLRELVGATAEGTAAPRAVRAR